MKVFSTMLCAFAVLSPFPFSCSQAGEMHADDGSLRGKGVIRGEVWIGGKRANGATVKFYQLQKSESAQLIKTTRTGSSGGYLVSLPADKSVSVIAEHSGFTSSAMRAWGLKPGKTVRVNLFIEPKKVADAIDERRGDAGLLHAIPNWFKRKQAEKPKGGDSERLRKK